MNYIAQLQKDVEAREQAIIRANKEIDLFFRHLHSDKFAGFDSQGERKDWIATADVIARLMEMRKALQID